MPTLSTPTRPFRSTAISATSPESPRCCCNRTRSRPPAPWSSLPCPRCPVPDAKATCAGCALGAASSSISNGAKPGSRADACYPLLAPPPSCAAKARRPRSTFAPGGPSIWRCRRPDPRKSSSRRPPQRTHSAIRHEPVAASPPLRVQTEPSVWTPARDFRNFSGESPWTRLNTREKW